MQNEAISCPPGECEDALVVTSYNQLSYFTDWQKDENHTVVSIHEFPELDFERFTAAIRKIVERHEILRTTFVPSAGDIKQKIIPAAEFDAVIKEPVEISSEEELERIVEAKYETTFDLATAPLFFIEIYRLPNGRSRILIVIHHIICDGYSSGVVRNEIYHLYHHGNPDGGQELKPLDFQYSDYAVWQRDFINSVQGDSHRQYWADRLSGFTPKVNLNFRDPGSNGTSGARKGIITTIDGDLYSRITAFIKANGLTYNTFFLGALVLTLYKLSHEKDISVFIRVSGRSSKYFGNLDVSKIYGDFTNTLILRNVIDENAGIVSFMQKVAMNFLQDLDYEAYPFDELIQRTAGIDPFTIYDGMVLMNYHNYSYFTEANYEKGLRVRAYGKHLRMKHAFTLAFAEYRNCIRMDMIFNSGLFHSGQMKKIELTLFATFQKIVTSPAFFTIHKI